MRRDNRVLDRHRVRLDDLTRLLVDERPGSITDVNLQAGEAPVAVREIAIPLVRRLRASTSLGISVCLGTLNPALYGELQEAWASIYIMMFEISAALSVTGNRNVPSGSAACNVKAVTSRSLAL